MKRSERTALISKIVSDAPGKVFGLSYFCDIFGTARSTVSEDISVVRRSLEAHGHGKLITVSGPGGGVRYLPFADEKSALDIQNRLCNALNDKNRILGGGFLYTSDIMFDPSFSTDMARVFAGLFFNTDANCVVTIETKGIPLALMTARLLNLPTVVVRREPRISEGPTISINYFSAAAEKMQKMSISKKAVKPGSRAIIIDDFMRAGGSIKGIGELLSELDVTVVGIGVGIASITPKTKKISGYRPLVYLGDVDESTGLIEVTPNFQIFENI